MTKKYYFKKGSEVKKSKHKSNPIIKISGVILLIFGLSIIGYYTGPILMWQFFF